MTNPDPPERARRGAIAEDLAEAFLRLSGYEIVDRNIRVGAGEIDLIARRGEWLILYEVRLRGASAFGHPVETIRGRKARALARAGRAYLSHSRGDASCWRFDAITITLMPDGEARIQSYRGIVPL